MSPGRAEGRRTGRGLGEWGLRRPGGWGSRVPPCPPEHRPSLPPQATSTGRTRVSTSSKLPGSMALSATWSSPRVWTSPGRSLSTRRRGEERAGLTSPHSWLWSCAGPLATGPFSSVLWRLTPASTFTPGTCSGPSGASTRGSSGLGWMAVIGWCWLTSASAGPTASPWTTRFGCRLGPEAKELDPTLGGGAAPVP